MDLTADILQGLHQRSGNVGNAVVRDTLKTVFKAAVAQTGEDQRRFRKGTDLGRLKAAVAIAAWVIYAWSSAWVDKICSCGIRYADLVGEDRFPMFREVTVHEDQDCSGSRVPRSKQTQHRLLDVLLAEIALARPIRVHQCIGPDWKFELHGGDDTSLEGTKTITARELLKLMDTSPLRAFQQAVEHCLNAKSSDVNQLDFRVEDLEAYMDNVIKP
ncbi:hypothetical protein LTR85_010803 [Meristemomyces frigidus]|nr:hypothetical protein LTR85_010803 [Meristemomyces frigidus]